MTARGPSSSNAAEPMPETLLHLGQGNPRRRARADARASPSVLGPGDAGAVARQRQDRERPAGQEMLDRAAAVRALVAHRRDDAGLRIAPADDLDAGRFAQRRVAAIAGDDEPAARWRPSASSHACCRRYRSRRRPRDARTNVTTPRSVTAARCCTMERRRRHDPHAWFVAVDGRCRSSAGPAGWHRSSAESVMSMPLTGCASPATAGHTPIASSNCFEPADSA